MFLPNCFAEIFSIGDSVRLSPRIFFLSERLTLGWSTFETVWPPKEEKRWLLTSLKQINPVEVEGCWAVRSWWQLHRFAVFFLHRNFTTYSLLLFFILLLLFTKHKSLRKRCGRTLKEHQAVGVSSGEKTWGDWEKRVLVCLK